MNRRKLYIILGRTLWMLLIAAIVVLLQSAMKSKQQSSCRGILVNIAAVNGKVFIDENDVKQIMAGFSSGKIEGRMLKSFPLRKMEARLRQEVWISDAQLFFDNEGYLHANVFERVPVARVFDVHGMSYYLDTSATVLPLSTTDRSDLPVFTNVPVVNKNDTTLVADTRRDIIAIALAINSDSFWMAQAAQIDVVAGNRYELYPAVGFHVVELGTADDMPAKLQRLKLFYRKVLANGAFNQYAKLSVAYKNQVVAVRGNGQTPGVDAAKAMEVFDQLVTTNKKEVNALAIENEKQTGGTMAEMDNAPTKATKDNSPPGDNAVVPAVQSPPDTTKKPKAVMPPKKSIN